jgi:hypothetical protein
MAVREKMTDEERLRRKREQAKVYRRKKAKKSPEEWAESQKRWHDKREAKQAQIDENADRVAGLYWERERIVAHLPPLFEQRDATMATLMELEQLISDEEQAAQEIAAQIA